MTQANTRVSPSDRLPLQVHLYLQQARKRTVNNNLPERLSPDLSKMEPGPATIKREEPDHEVIDLSKVAPAKSDLGAFWETAGPVTRELMHTRHVMYKIAKAAAANGLEPTAAKELMRMLDKLSTFPFLAGDYERIKIGVAVKMVTKPEIFGDVIAGRALQLRERWRNGNFSPEPFAEEEEELIDSSDEEMSNTEGEEEEEEEARAPRRPAVALGLRQQIDECVARHLRGMQVIHSRQGRRVYKLDPRGNKRRADVFGHNGLQVGDWWPFQSFALKDGAHGCKQGGIYGQINIGAFSVVVSGGMYEDNDYDTGNRILYSGSKGGSNDDPQSEAPYTAGTKSLVISSKSNKAVRVLRAAKKHGRFSPKHGIRYDGLYQVQSYTIQTDPEGKKFYQFVMIRLDNQPPIDRNRPTPVEIAALDRIKKM